MDMSTPLKSLQDFLLKIWNDAQGLTASYVLVQLALIAGALILAALVTWQVTPQLKAALRRKSTRPFWLTRLMAVMVRHLRLALFVAFATSIVLIMQQTTPWPARYYFIKSAATLGAALLAVGVLSHLIKSRPLRLLFRWSAWIVATVYLLGYMPDAQRFLGSLAISLGNFRLSALTVIKGTIFLGALILIARIVRAFLVSRIETIQDLSPSMKVLSQKGISVILFGLAIIVGMQAVGFDLSSLAVLTGAVGLGIGFGLQKVVSNLISGIILLLDKSIKPGDVVSVGDTFGWISTLGARYVSVLTRDGREYLIPNEDLITGQVVNWSHSSKLVRVDVHFGVSYDADPHLIKKLCAQAPLGCDRVIETPAPVCHITGFGDSSVDFILRFWITDPSKGLTNIRGDVYLRVWDVLKAQNIEIPYPKRDLMIKEVPSTVKMPPAGTE